jgi:hypothetical protein
LADEAVLPPRRDGNVKPPCPSTRCRSREASTGLGPALVSRGVLRDPRLSFSPALAWMDIGFRVLGRPGCSGKSASTLARARPRPGGPIKRWARQGTAEDAKTRLGWRVWSRPSGSLVSSLGSGSWTFGQSHTPSFRTEDRSSGAFASAIPCPTAGRRASPCCSARIGAQRAFQKS